MLHAFVERFDVMGERGNILGWFGEVNKAIVSAGCNLRACIRRQATRNTCARTGRLAEK
jgi:hypothetical protein